jgi:Domain of unknown function (DUF4249)
MKNKITTYMAGAALLMALASCEKVIDIDIDEADKKYVIEGSVSNSAAEPAEVKISQTKKFTDDNSFNGISGATVTIQVNNGTVYPLAETATGIYRTAAFTGAPGSSYRLTVTINGTAYTAVSVMPARLVTLDTLTVNDLAFGGSTYKTVYPSYKDPAGPGDSYRFVQYVNGALVKKIFVQNDELSDGLTITRPFINQDGDIKSGDVVKVNMLCIDPYVYKYWYSMDQAATGANQSATPANPVSNISGGVLGYFSAHSINSKTIVVP